MSKLSVAPPRLDEGFDAAGEVVCVVNLRSSVTSFGLGGMAICQYLGMNAHIDGHPIPPYSRRA
jgi:hypothetical protein